MEAKISVSKALKYGWQTFVNNLALLVPLSLGVSILHNIPEVIQGVLNDVLGGSFEPGSYKEILFKGMPEIILYLVVSVLTVGFFRVALILGRGGQATFKDFFLPVKLYGKAAFIILAVGLGLILGFLLLIVPSIIFFVMTVFVLFVLLDYPNNYPTQIIKRSIEFTKGSRWEIFTFLLIVYVPAGLISVLLAKVADPTTKFLYEVCIYALVVSIGTLGLAYMYMTLTKTETEVDQ